MSNDIKPMGYLTEEHQVISPGIHKVGMSPVYDSAALDLARQQGRNDALIYNGMADRHEKDVLVVELRDQLATAQRLQAELSEVSPAKNVGQCPTLSRDGWCSAWKDGACSIGKCTVYFCKWSNKQGSHEHRTIETG